ncbi:MAG: hypothetical protein WBZ67_09565, partial [Pseudolabrys sp.]
MAAKPKTVENSNKLKESAFHIKDSAAHMGRSTAREDSAGRRTALAADRAQRRFSPVDLLNLWEPTGAWEEYPGLIYGEGQRRKLDVYKP